MKLRYYFDRNFETSDNHEIPSLKTRYYTYRKDDAMNKIKETLQSLKYKINGYDVERGEIVFSNEKCTGNIVVTSISFRQTSVDIQVYSFVLAILPSLKGMKIIEKIYEEIGKVLK